MIRALFKFGSNPYEGVDIDTTSNSGQYRDLSPFVLPAPPAQNLENLWQFSKVYRQYADALNNPTPAYYEWRDGGFNDIQAHRYPMGKGAIPLYSLRDNERLGYIEARKKIYATIYAENVISTESFKLLQKLYARDGAMVLRDYDAYDHNKFGMTLIDVINNPKRKMGHAFVLIMLLTDTLEECINS